MPDTRRSKPWYVESAMLRCIVYDSRAFAAFSDLALDLLGDQARKRNLDCGITGRLLYSRQRFVQLIEGPPESIETIFATILADPRHSDVRVLLDRLIDRRFFSQWAMDALSGESLTNDEITRMERALRLIDNGAIDRPGAAVLVTQLILGTDAAMLRIDVGDPAAQASDAPSPRLAERFLALWTLQHMRRFVDEAQLCDAIVDVMARSIGAIPGTDPVLVSEDDGMSEQDILLIASEIQSTLHDNGFGDGGAIQLLLLAGGVAGTATAYRIARSRDFRSLPGEKFQRSVVGLIDGAVRGGKPLDHDEFGLLHPKSS
eukprot:gene12950-13051_t